MQSFVHWLDERETVPLIQALQAQADDWRACRDRPRAQAARQGRGPVDAVLEALSRALTQKMLHGALAELHSADGEHRTAAGRSTVTRLFLRGSTHRPADGPTGSDDKR